MVSGFSFKPFGPRRTEFNADVLPLDDPAVCLWGRGLDMSQRFRLLSFVPASLVSRCIQFAR
jgi:hypothetical protein